MKHQKNMQFWKLGRKKESDFTLNRVFFVSVFLYGFFGSAFLSADCWTKANQLQVEGKLDQAIKEYSLCAKNPLRRDLAILRVASLTIELGNPEEAATHLERYLTNSNPHNLSARVLLVNIYRLIKNREQAQIQLDLANRMFPGDVIVVRLMQELIKDGLIEDFNRELFRFLGADFSEIKSEVGQLFLGVYRHRNKAEFSNTIGYDFGMHPLASKYFSNLGKIQEGSVSGLVQEQKIKSMVLYLSIFGELENAKDVLKSELESGSKSEILGIILTQLLLSEDKVKEAKDTLNRVETNKVTSKNDKMTRYHLSLVKARVHAKVGEPVLALQEYQKLESMIKNDVDRDIETAQYLEKLGSKQKALMWIAKVPAGTRLFPEQARWIATLREDSGADLPSGTRIHKEKSR